MKTNIVLFCLVAFILGGCYDDKGNYNYKEVNNLTFTFTPEAKDNSYKFKQPALDTLVVTFAPTITQTKAKDESNLEYLWAVSRTVKKVEVWDTIYTKELTLKFPPKKKTSYNRVLFRIRDITTGVEYYSALSMSTVVPFTRSWFVLHGELGDRKVGVIEEPNEESTAVTTFDAYQDIWGRRRFQNAIGMVYSPRDGSKDINTREHLTVFEQDSCSWMHAFNFLVTKRYELMMPLPTHPQLAYGTSSVLVDKSGKFYHTNGLGYYFTAKAKSEVANYVVDKIYPAISRVMTIWDQVHHKLMYYDASGNRCYPQWNTSDTEHPDNDAGNDAEVTPFDDNLFARDELKNKKVIYLGQGNSDISLEGAFALLKDVGTGEYFAYQIGYGQGSSFVNMTKAPLPNLSLDENSQVATSYYFKDQIFYTKGSTVYLYNTVSGEEVELYDAGASIARLKFRSAQNYDRGYGDDGLERDLGIVVNKPDGTGELHEIFLDEAGDLIKSLVHKGFGPIQDIYYSTLERMIL